MILATTTSTQDSGLLDEILPLFDKGSDCVVKTVAVGSGQAIEMGEKGDADVLLVHSPEDEEQFMADGHGSSREAVMHNDFVVVGPPDDPARVADAGSAAEALTPDRRREGVVRLARRRLGHPCEGAGAVGGGGDRTEGLLVHRDRPGDG